MEMKQLGPVLDRLDAACRGLLQEANVVEKILVEGLAAEQKTRNQVDARIAEVGVEVKNSGISKSKKRRTRWKKIRDSLKEKTTDVVLGQGV